MTLAHWHCVVLIAITLFSHASAKSTVHVIDSPDGNYLQSSGQAKTFTDLSEIVTALLNLDPLFKVDSDTSTRVIPVQAITLQCSASYHNIVSLRHITNETGLCFTLFACFLCRLPQL